jgi:hypothetical protein
LDLPKNKLRDDLSALRQKYSRPRPLRVIVYGLFSKRTEVTAILDESGLFFQQPDASEFDRRVRYFNPMYLVLPGKRMPRLASSSGIGGLENRCEPTDEHLEEIKKSHILNIFENANSPSSCETLKIKQSSRIISTLKE